MNPVKYRLMNPVKYRLILMRYKVQRRLPRMTQVLWWIPPATVLASVALMVCIYRFHHLTRYAHDTQILWDAGCWGLLGEAVLGLVRRFLRCKRCGSYGTTHEYSRKFIGKTRSYGTESSHSTIRHSDGSYGGQIESTRSYPTEVSHYRSYRRCSVCGYESVRAASSTNRIG